MTDSRSSFQQILRTSAVTGGAQVINLLLGLVRVKISALYIGAAGVGLLGNYQTIQGLLTVLAGLGIQPSGVRAIAEAAGKGDTAALNACTVALRRISWLTGVAGALLTVALCLPLSHYTFGSNRYALPIALLGTTILLGNLAGGQLAVVQGLRQIGDLARANVVAAVASTLVLIPCYYWLGPRGIVPSLLLTSVFTLLASRHYARRFTARGESVSWPASLRLARGMLTLGFSLMVSSLGTMLTTYLIRVLVTRDFGLAAAGVYGAAFALSGIFVNFVLSAMGADFYPRLTSHANDHPAANRLVNQQTQVVVALTLPGFVATILFAKWLVPIFYSHAFDAAVGLLQWFVLGCFGKVISWPLGFVVLAKNKSRLFLVTELAFSVLNIVLVIALIHVRGIEGVAMAFLIQYFVYVAVAYTIGRALTGFAWTWPTKLGIIAAATLMGLAFLTQRMAVLDGPLGAATPMLGAIGLSLLILRHGRQ